MDLKLVVLAGAKEGTEIPLKKDKFVIGRAKEAHLRAGSEAISRQHCVFRLRETGWTVRDLGSRNGTHVNDVRIEAETPLKPGDELRVGPLRFRIAPLLKPAAAATRPHDINRAKQPPVQSVADIAQRAANQSVGATSEDDITDWLFGPSTSSSEAAMKETRTIRMEETRAMGRPSVAPTPLAKEPAVDAEEVIADDSPAAAESPSTSDAEKSGWKWLKFGKGSKTPPKKVGKLPPRPTDVSKDSREAAADILREMTRRR